MNPQNLEDAVESFGKDRVYGKRRRGESRMHTSTTWCVECDKWAYESIGAAREIIGRMIRQGNLDTPDQFCFAPYPCPAGDGWHNGHNQATRELIRNGRCTGITPK